MCVFKLLIRAFIYDNITRLNVYIYIHTNLKKAKKDYKGEII